MRKFIFFILLFILIPEISWAQNKQIDRNAELQKLNWQNGPIKGFIGSKATIDVPKGFVFLGEADTSRYIELAGNPPMDNHYLIAPKNFSWWAVFSFKKIGYVKDDEKIDADDLLKNLKEGDAESNIERKKLGLAELYTDGWQVPAFYNSDTKRLEWGVRLRSNGQLNVNYTTRILGRTGVMEATLIGDIETLAATTKEFKASLEKFKYSEGESYSEFKSGDKVAEYGLAALVLGGAAAVATKKGLWAVLAGFFAAFWKILAGLAVAAGAGLSSIFKKKKE